MSFRSTNPLQRVAFRFHPIHLLVALALVELMLLAVGLLLMDLGWRPSPAPVVTDVQLVTT